MNANKDRSISIPQLVYSPQSMSQCKLFLTLPLNFNGSIDFHVKIVMNARKGECVLDLVFVLILLGLLQIKHMFADFYLQTPFMLINRSVFLHPGRVLHCVIHSASSALIFLVMGVPFGITIGVCIAEFVVHYGIDFGKGVWSERAGHTPSDASYWRAFGVDQMLHQLTYIGMILALA